MWVPGTKKHQGEGKLELQSEFPIKASITGCLLSVHHQGCEIRAKINLTLNKRNILFSSVFRSTSTCSFSSPPPGR